MLTVFAIIVILVWWAVFGPLAFVRGNGSNLPIRNCPACGFAGRVAGFGRFRCGSCGKHFVLGYRGRPASSLLTAALPSFIVIIIIAALLVAMWAHGGNDFIYLPAVLAVQIGVMIFTTVQTKRFPNVERD